MNLEIQDDHSRRMTDIAFRHLYGAYNNYLQKQDHLWVKEVSNDDSRFGKSEYMLSRNNLNILESEEYTQSIAATLFSHIWLLSAANYYRQHYKNNTTIKNTSSPQDIAVQLNLHKTVISYAEEMHYIRNTIAHLVESDKKKTSQITDLDFKAAYKYTKVTWVIFCAILRNYGLRPDLGSWGIQTSLYSLPRTIVCNEK